MENVSQFVSRESAAGMLLFLSLSLSSLSSSLVNQLEIPTASPGINISWRIFASLHDNEASSDFPRSARHEHGDRRVR